jgi:opacity protein-like surface antigen
VGRISAGIFAGLLALRAVPAAQAANPAISASETSAQLGLTAGYSNYEENVFPQDTENGALLGFHAGLSALSRSNLSAIGLRDLYIGIEYDFSAGFLNYHGNLQTAGFPPYRANDNDYYNTAIVRLGLGRPVSGRAEIIPYIAGGYQNWYRNIAGRAGYGEFYQSGLIGGGIKLDFTTGPTLVWSVSAESLAEIGAGVSVPSQDFSGDFGTSARERVSLDADYRLTDAWHAFAGLGITHYEYSGSKPNSFGSYEPLSTTFQINSQFGISYGF